MSLDHWPVRPLRAFADVRLGRQRSPERAEGPSMVPYLRAANVKDGLLDLRDVKSMDFRPDEQVVYALRRGDVLMTEGAGSLAAVGASAVWSGEIEGAVCFQNTLLRLRPRADNDSRFLMWWARHAYGSGLLASVAEGANIYHLGAEDIRLLPASFPSPRTQRAIADYLDAENGRIAAMVDARRRQQTLLAARAVSETEQRVLGRVGSATLEVTESAYFGLRPTDWRETSVRHLDIEVQTGPFGSQLHADEYVKGGTPVINPMHLNGGHINPSESMSVSDEKRRELQRHILRRDDLVVARRGELGRVAVVDDEADGYLCGTGSVRLRLRGSSIRPRYLGFLLASAPLRAHFGMASVGSTMDNLSAAAILAAPVLVPPVDAQVAIEREIDEAEGHAMGTNSAMSRQVDLLLERRNALITAAVTGQLAIPGVAA